MKSSIRRQMMVVFVGLIVFILVLMFIVNSGFLEQYYAIHKQADLTSTFTSINKAIQSSQIGEETVINRLERQLEKANISAIVVQTDGSIMFSTVRDDDNPLYFKLLSYIFDKNQDNGKMLKSTDSYKIYKTKDFMNQTEYLEMWGNFSDRSGQHGVSESVPLCRYHRE